MWGLAVPIISVLVLWNCKWLWLYLESVLLSNLHTHSIKLTFYKCVTNCSILLLLCCVVLWKTDLPKGTFFLMEKCASSLFNACWYSVPVSVSVSKTPCVSGPVMRTNFFYPFRPTLCYGCWVAMWLEGWRCWELELRHVVKLLWCAADKYKTLLSIWAACYLFANVMSFIRLMS